MIKQSKVRHHLAVRVLAGSLALVVGIGLSFQAQAEPQVEAAITLNPAGDFTAKMSEVSGEAVIDGDSVTAENITVGLGTLKTGLPLRDRHAKEKYLEVEKYPKVVLVNAKGKAGKGTATIRLKDIEKEVQGTYVIEGGELKADFPIKLSDFKITGISYLGIGVEDTVKIHVTVPVKKK